MFSVYLNLSLSCPALKSKLLWNGTLISEAIGLESFLANSPAFADSPVVAPSEVLAGEGVWAASPTTSMTPAQVRWQMYLMSVNRRCTQGTR